MQIVKLACERPEVAGRSLSQWALSQWDCEEICRQLVADGTVTSIGRESVRTTLASHRLKPWRQHAWLSSKVPRDDDDRKKVEAICDLDTRELRPDEMVLCLDEMTSLQPRPRKTGTKPACPDRPVQVEHEYSRCGALNLFAAFDTRTGHVWGTTARRKRQVELIELLEKIDREVSPEITTIHVVLDNVSTHHGKPAKKWLSSHPRFCFTFPPVHCSHKSVWSDESDRAMVFHPASQAIEDRRLQRSCSSSGPTAPVYRGMESSRSPVPMDDPVLCQGHGQM